MNESTIPTRFQVVIPCEIRKKYNLKPGQKVVFISIERMLQMVIVPSIEEARGMFKGIDTTVEREGDDRM